jgi:hypothetical protein
VVAYVYELWLNQHRHGCCSWVTVVPTGCDQPLFVPLLLAPRELVRGPCELCGRVDPLTAVYPWLAPPLLCAAVLA